MARTEVGHENLNELAKKNASRDAHAFVGRWGMSWKVPLSYLDYVENGVPTKIAYIRPKDFLVYLAEKTPELLLGGCTDISVGMSHLHSFWKHYHKIHPTHVVFGDGRPERMWKNTFCLALHGDEGRGLKKGNTCVVMMETCLGVDTISNMQTNKGSHHCDTCEDDEPTAKRLRGSIAVGSGSSSKIDPAVFQATNLKQHSFLTKYVLSVLPNNQYKDSDVLDRIFQVIVQDFHSLLTDGFVAGGRRWFAACVGMKGDLKWFQKIGNFTRAFGSQISINKPMCHQCLAGTADRPFEDSNHYPSWLSSEFVERPYEVQAIILHVPFEMENSNDSVPHERFFRRDIFHNTKTGVFRSFVASSVMLILRLRYFHEVGAANDRETLLQRAYQHFNLFCRATQRTASLRSFSASFFNAMRWTVYPWVNSKGSDTSHLMAWVSTLAVSCQNDLKSPEHLQLLDLMHSTAEAGRAFQRITYSHGIWLRKKCAHVLYQSLHRFLKGYNALAFLSLHKFQYTGYGMTAKYHLLAHEKYDLLKRLDDPTTTFCQNPQLFGCEMNEDVIGKLSRLSRRVSTRNTSERSLQLYLIKSKCVYRRWAQNKKLAKPKRHPVR